MTETNRFFNQFIKVITFAWFKIETFFNKMLIMSKKKKKKNFDVIHYFY